MRYPVSLLVVLALAGCGRAPDDAAAPAADTAPGVDVTAAPGVAFRYLYGFRLPAQRIAAVQEAHAAACERLGVQRCRVTAMRYTRDTDNRIDATLGFALAPELARAFGRDGVRAIEAADGMVLTAQITGEDAAAKIAELSGQRDAAAAARLTEARDAATRDATVAIAGQRAALARTPVTFDYVSGDAVRSFDPASPFTRAADLAVLSARWTIGVSLAAVGIVLPPLLLGLLAMGVWLRGRRFWLARAMRAA